MIHFSRACLRLDSRRIQLADNPGDCLSRPAIILAATNSNELPSKSFQDRLPLHILQNLRFTAVPAFAIAFNRDPLISADGNHVDPIRANLPLLNDMIALCNQRFCNFRLKRRIGSLLNCIVPGCKRLRIGSVFQKPPAHIPRLQIGRIIKGMHNPELIFCAADRNIVALPHRLAICTLSFARCHCQWAIGFVAVDKRKEDHISLVSLEIGRISTENLMLFIFCKRNPIRQLSANQLHLIVAKHGNNTETLVFVLRMFHTCLDQCDNRVRFFFVGLASSLPYSGDAEWYNCRFKRRTSRFPKGLDFSAIGQHVAVAYNVRNASEMLPKHQRLIDLCRNVIQ